MQMTIHKLRRLKRKHSRLFNNTRRLIHAKRTAKRRRRFNYWVSQLTKLERHYKP